MKKAIRYFNDNAEKLSAEYNSLDRALVHAELLKHLPQGSLTMLDVGAGSGADAAFFAEQGHHVVAVEPAGVLRDIANKNFKNSNIEWVDDSLPAMKAVSGSFDVVYAIGTIQYLGKQARRDAFNRMAGLLKDGGLLEIQFPNPPSREHQFMIGNREIETFIKAFNKAAKGQGALHVLYHKNIPVFNGRTALNGQPLHFNTTVLKYLKTTP